MRLRHFWRFAEIDSEEFWASPHRLISTSLGFVSELLLREHVQHFRGIAGFIKRDQSAIVENSKIACRHLTILVVTS